MHKNILTEPVVRFPGSKVFRPLGGDRHLSVVLLHGSEGGSAGYRDEEAKELASHGYSVLVLCYFDCARKPEANSATLKDVDTSMVLDAIQWLREQPFSDGRVVVNGWSRGGELAMIVGSLNAGGRLPEALIAHTPSDVFNGSFNWLWTDAKCWTCKGPSCSKNSPKSQFKWNGLCGPDDPNRIDLTKSAFLINGTSVKEGSRIAIEKFSGPVLITVGTKDKMWPVDQTRRIEKTLKQANRAAEIHYFEGDGHIFKGSKERCRRNLTLAFLQKVPKNADHKAASAYPTISAPSHAEAAR
ncbi:MAG: prolyl oligopeptidase family serine peptidase [Bdellovibrionaceae bacterium]|nr:prolyl oligopeptidase family serine peptidase [Pseudobdellovibrionaceae bacterium]